MRNLFVIQLFALLLIVSGKGFAQNHLDKGWKYFNENKLDDARDEFYDATKNPRTAQAASLSWAFVNSVDQKPDYCFEHFKTFIQKEKDINPYLYNYWFGDLFVNKDKLSKDRVEFINELLESGKLNFTNTGFANLSLARHYQKIRKFSKADEYRALLGNIVEWQLVGNFENISGSGFNKDFGPLQHPENDFEFVNRNGAPIKWFTIKRYKPGVWVDIAYHSYTDNSITYAQTFVQSPKDQEVVLHIGAKGSLKVWLNDKLMLAEEDERSLGMDAYTVKVKLKRGYNRLLLQIGQSDDVDDSEFFVRFSDLNNKLIIFNVSAEPKSYPKSYNYQPVVYKHFAEEYFENLEKNHPGKVYYKVLLQDLYQRLDKTYEARKLLLEARDLAPESSYIAGKLLLVYKREEAETLLSKLLEEVKKTDPDNPIALRLVYKEALEKEDWEEAEIVLNNLEESIGNTEEVAMKRINLLLKKEENGKAFDLINEAHKKFPDNIDFTYYAYLVQASAYKNMSAGLSILKKYNKKNFSTSVTKVIARHYDATGNLSMFLKTMEQLIEMEPYTPRNYEDVAGVLADRHNYSKAIDYYEKLIENVPYVGYYHALLADAYKENDDETEAEESYKLALLYNPNDYDTRKDYREFLGENDIFDYFEEPDVYELYKKSDDADDYPEDNSLIVLNETQRIVYQGGGSEEKHYLMVKVFNKTGVDTWKEYYIDTKGQDLLVEKTEVLKKDGDVVKAERNEEEEPGRIIFTDLQEGDAILVVYKLQSYNYGKLLKHFWDLEYFDHFYPTSKQVYSLLVEGNNKFDYKMMNSDMKPVIDNPDDNFTKYTWEIKDVESIKSESYMDELVDFGKMLHYSSIPDWTFINKWYYDISTTKAKSNFEVKDVLNNILEGKENLSDYQKVHLIYDYVVKEIRYSSIPFRQSGIVPQKASKTINTKIGDCKDVATLFIALCREAGFKAEIMLVNTRDNGEKELALPNTGFNHAISKVWIDGKPYVVELTSDYLPFSTMGAGLKKAFVLDIDNGNNSKPYLLDMPTRQPNKIVRTADITFDADGNMNISRTATRWGDYAAGIRANYRDIGQKKRIKELTNAISSDFAKIKIHTFDFDSTLYTTDDSVFYKYTFTVYDPFIAFENKKLLKIPLAMKQEPLDFLNDDRKYPLALWRYINDDSRQETIVIHTPKGMSLSSLPKNKHYVSKFGEYWLTFKRKGRDLVITRKIVFKKDMVEVDEFEEFATFFKNIIKADETQLGYKVY
jgi:transglutaminase-like putative cysteine protease/predicted Zn-dependent protease